MLCSKYMVGSDGRTAHERRRDRRCRIPEVAFCERVLYKQIREGKNRRDKLESEDRESVCLGHSRNAYECLIGTTEGVVRAYSFRRRDETSRLDARLIQGIKGTHQQPDPGRPGRRIRFHFHFEDEQADKEDEAAPEAADTVHRRFRIFPKILHKEGSTYGCGGCRHKRGGPAGSRDHSNVCRGAASLKK